MKMRAAAKLAYIVSLWPLIEEVIGRGGVFSIVEVEVAVAIHQNDACTEIRHFYSACVSQL